MGFSGYTEYLCPKGHYTTRDARVYYYDDYKPSTTCSCGDWWALVHDVDTTNGMDTRYPDTMSAPKEEIGWDDIPHTDHYGNNYYSKWLKYKPVGEGWIPYPTKEEMEAAQAVAQQEEAERQRFSAALHNTPPLEQYRVFAGETLLGAFTNLSEAEEFYFDQETSTNLLHPEGQKS